MLFRLQENWNKLFFVCCYSEPLTFIKGNCAFVHNGTKSVLDQRHYVFKDPIRRLCMHGFGISMLRYVDDAC
jgi:hypothetical protein